MKTGTPTKRRVTPHRRGEKYQSKQKPELPVRVQWEPNPTPEVLERRAWENSLFWSRWARGMREEGR